MTLAAFDAIDTGTRDLGDLVDDLVADLIDAEQRHVRVATETLEKLTTQYPQLAERYGDWNIGLSFTGMGGRVARQDIHRRLREKGLSLRAIAAQTGVAEATVRRDLTPASNDAPAQHAPASNDAPPDTVVPTPDAPVPGQQPAVPPVHTAAPEDEPPAPKVTPLRAVGRDESDAHTAALGIDPGERGFVALMRGVISELEEAELVNAGVVTPGKVAVMRDLFAESERLHAEWAPHLHGSLREVK